MNRLVRLAWVVLRSLFAPPCPPTGPCRTPLRVWPNDLDVFLHVNNGVYLTLCDLGRVDLMLRSGSFRAVSGRKRVFLVAAETVQLRRPLRLFQRFDLETRVIGWDDRAFFVEHRFVARAARRKGGAAPGADDDVVALAVVEGRVVEAGGGRVPPEEMVRRLGLPPDPPPLPDWVVRWRDDQRALREAGRSAEPTRAGPP